MSLFEKLQKATSEEDVKDLYIKALGLKSYQKNLIDIQTKEVWFEAKAGYKTSTYEMFTQLLHYVQQALNSGVYVPPFLCVIDTRKAAIMRTADVLPFLKAKTINWGKSASKYTQEALDAVSSFIGTHFVSFNIETHEQEFIDTVRNAIKKGEIIRTQITPDNLKQVFDKWVNMIGREIIGISEENYNLMFFADIMSDGTISTHENLPAELIHRNGKPTFLYNGKLYELGNREGYRQFWSIYNRPPKEEYRNYMLERRDCLIATDEREFKGAYYTPLKVVDKAYDLLEQSLGPNWQREYIIWDMCCGVGNLEIKHSNHRNLYMSTLDQADVDVMKATKTCVSAYRFQYDYLNDDIKDDGEIDYNITNKLPKTLRDAIKGKKKILVLINPPYAEDGNGVGGLNKTGVAKTRFATYAMKDWGKATNELFTQFMVRVYKEIPHAIIAMFSTLKYVNAPNFETFRNLWHGIYMGGFIVHSKAFDGINGNFPIGFLIWKQSNSSDCTINEVSTEVYDKNINPIGEKTFYNISTTKYLNNWIDRVHCNRAEHIPLKNCITPATAKGAKARWADNAIGHMLCDANDFQNANNTALFSSVHGIGHKGGFFVTPDNLWKACVVFTVRKIIPATWVNNRDQFFQPNFDLADEFITDCLIWMLFNNSNLTASADNLEWGGKKWSIVNHFIPFSEDDVNSPQRFESDFMVRYIADKTFSEESQNVMREGKKLWQKYFSDTDEYNTRNRLKLNRCDVGWYQVRNALEERNNLGNSLPVLFDNFNEAYRLLTKKLDTVPKSVSGE